MKIAFMVLLWMVVGGCGSDIPDTWQTYYDPDDRFELAYPPDWKVATASGEIQFFDDLTDGKNSVKLSLFEESRTLDEIQTLTEEDRSTQTVEKFETAEVNGLPVLIRHATNAWGESTLYYYGVQDHVFALVALYFDNDSTIREQVAMVQRSFRVPTDGQNQQE